jgi:hypothetical protein
LPAEAHKSNFTSSDLKACFLKTNGELNPSAQTARHEFEESMKREPISGTLRIHLELPGFGAIGSTKPSVSGNDIIAYVTCENLDDFFCEGLHFDREMISIKKIIRYIGMLSLNVHLYLFSLIDSFQPLHLKFVGAQLVADLRSAPVQSKGRSVSGVAASIARMYNDVICELLLTIESFGNWQNLVNK